MTHLEDHFPDFRHLLVVLETSSFCAAGSLQPPNASSFQQLRPKEAQVLCMPSPQRGESRLLAERGSTLGSLSQLGNNLSIKLNLEDPGELGGEAGHSTGGKEREVKM